MDLRRLRDSQSPNKVPRELLPAIGDVAYLAVIFNWKVEFFCQLEKNISYIIKKWMFLGILQLLAASAVKPPIGARPLHYFPFGKEEFAKALNELVLLLHSNNVSVGKIKLFTRLFWLVMQFSSAVEFRANLGSNFPSNNFKPLIDLAIRLIFLFSGRLYKLVCAYCRMKCGQQRNRCNESFEPGKPTLSLFNFIATEIMPWRKQMTVFNKLISLII